MGQRKHLGKIYSSLSLSNISSSNEKDSSKEKEAQNLIEKYTKGTVSDTNLNMLEEKGQRKNQEYVIEKNTCTPNMQNDVHSEFLEKIVKKNFKGIEYQRLFKKKNIRKNGQGTQNEHLEKTSSPSISVKSFFSQKESQNSFKNKDSKEFELKKKLDLLKGKNISKKKNDTFEKNT